MEKPTRRNRTRYELLADLLISSKGGAKKTALMYRANLSFQLLNKYLSFLMENGFVERKEGYFFPSQRGLTYLHRFARYQHDKHEMIRSEERIQSILSSPSKVGKSS